MYNNQKLYLREIKVKESYTPIIYEGDTCEILKAPQFTNHSISLTFLDPPFNQNKSYGNHDDQMDPGKYWDWMTEVCQLIYNHTRLGGSIFFMHREKNTEYVARALRKSGFRIIQG